MRFIKWLNEISKKDILLVGGKGANLGEVASIVQIPPGFVVTSEAFLYFLNTTGLRDKIKEIIKEFISRGDPDEYEKASAVIRGLIERSPLPSDLEREIAESYKKLCEVTGVNNVAVAVRSSATAEDIPEASFAGQQDTYLNVRGVENVIHYVKKVWSSLYTARALYYRDKMGIPHEKSLMAVVVQKLVNAKSAGVIFTLDPTTGDRSRVVIEASWGLGEGVVRGIVTPDEYVVDKKTLSIVERRISVKKVAVVRDESGLTKEVEVSIDKAERPALTDEEIVELSKMAIRLEEHYGHPVDIEFAVDVEMSFPKNLFILQVRPETVWSRREEKPKKEEEAPAGTVVVKGIPASPGVAVGTVKICLTVEEAKKKLQKGDILVTKMTDPDWVPYMRLAAAIVTDEGGRTSHAAIVSRELGIPAVVGTGNATAVLKDGEVYTVDGSKGIVMVGAVARAEPAPVAATGAPPHGR